jgi:hypothetical protein
MPLGRVVSPLDAVLNAIGATAAGLITAFVHRSAAHVTARSGGNTVRSGLTG